MITINLEEHEYVFIKEALSGYAKHQLLSTTSKPCNAQTVSEAMKKVDQTNKILNKYWSLLNESI